MTTEHINLGKYLTEEQIDRRTALKDAFDLTSQEVALRRLMLGNQRMGSEVDAFETWRKQLRFIENGDLEHIPAWLLQIGAQQVEEAMGQKFPNKNDIDRGWAIVKMALCIKEGK